MTFALTKTSLLLRPVVVSSRGAMCVLHIPCGGISSWIGKKYWDLVSKCVWMSRDKLRWSLSEKGIFTVSSFYKELMWQNIDFPQKFIWKIKIPLKMKKILWLITHNSILTKDVLIHRGGKGDSLCQFCDQEETINHLFLLCPLAKFMWNIQTS